MEGPSASAGIRASHTKLEKKDGFIQLAFWEHLKIFKCTSSSVGAFPLGKTENQKTKTPDSCQAYSEHDLCTWPEPPSVSLRRVISRGAVLGGNALGPFRVIIKVYSHAMSLRFGSSVGHCKETQ